MLSFQQLEAALAEDDVNIFDVDAADEWAGPRFYEGSWVKMAGSNEPIGKVVRITHHVAMVWFGAHTFREIPKTEAFAEAQLELALPGVSFKQYHPDKRKRQRPPMTPAGSWVLVDNRAGLCLGDSGNSDKLVWFGDSESSRVLVYRVPPALVQRSPYANDVPIP